MIQMESKDKFLLLVLSLIIVASVFDIVTDLSHNVPLDHVIKEILLFVVSITAVFWLMLGLRDQQRQVGDLKRELENAKQQVINLQPEQYVIDGRKRLSDVISQQFNEWSLSPSEKEVGWLLLKGLSLKEIAAIRETLEKTVRQQASSVYKKSNLSGRHAFSAWFIEDIL